VSGKSLPEPGIGFARAGDKVGALTNRQCKKCGGGCYRKKDDFHCERCGPQKGDR
jgi:hypothetical protein